MYRLQLKPRSKLAAFIALMVVSLETLSSNSSTRTQSVKLEEVSQLDYICMCGRSASMRLTLTATRTLLCALGYDLALLC
jgi:hypothetical protein